MELLTSISEHKVQGVLGAEKCDVSVGVLLCDLDHSWLEGGAWLGWFYYQHNCPSLLLRSLNHILTLLLIAAGLREWEMGVEGKTLPAPPSVLHPLPWPLPPQPQHAHTRKYTCNAQGGSIPEKWCWEAEDPCFLWAPSCHLGLCPTEDHGRLQTQHFLGHARYFPLSVWRRRAAGLWAWVHVSFAAASRKQNPCGWGLAKHRAFQIRLGQKCRSSFLFISKSFLKYL